MTTSSTNMYALHEHGESHDESCSESEYKLKKKSSENNAISGETETEVDPDSIIGDDVQPTNAKIGNNNNLLFSKEFQYVSCRFEF